MHGASSLIPSYSNFQALAHAKNMDPSIMDMRTRRNNICTGILHTFVTASFVLSIKPWHKSSKSSRLKVEESQQVGADDTGGFCIR